MNPQRELRHDLAAVSAGRDEQLAPNPLPSVRPEPGHSRTHGLCDDLEHDLAEASECVDLGRPRDALALMDFAMTWSKIWQKLRSVSDLGRPRDALVLASPAAGGRPRPQLCARRRAAALRVLMRPGLC